MGVLLGHMCTPVTFNLPNAVALGVPHAVVTISHKFVAGILLGVNCKEPPMYMCAAPAEAGRGQRIRWDWLYR